MLSNIPNNSYNLNNLNNLNYLKVIKGLTNIDIIIEVMNDTNCPKKIFLYT